MPAGQKEREQNEKERREKVGDLKDKYINLNYLPSVMVNQNCIDQARIVTNIFVGMAAGTLGFGLMQGILWWLLMGLITSTLLTVRLSMLGTNQRGDANKFFASVVSTAFGSTGSGFAIFSLFWIMFFNIVYVV